VTKLAALVAAAMLGLNAYVFYFMGSEESLPPRISFDTFPRTIDDWHCRERESMGEEIEHRLGVTDYWLCNYERSEEPDDLVNVYLGYHQRQVREGAKSFAESSIHPPRHCIPGSGWNIIDSEIVTVDIPDIADKPVNRLIIAKGPARQLVYYWYQERGRVIASDYWKIAYLFWDRATRARSDGSLVRFTIPIVNGDEEEADAEFVSLATRILPRLPEFVPN